jgi:hypothetical protein
LSVFILGTARPALAQGAGPINFIVKISASPSIGGTAVGAATGTINGQPVVINKLSWTDTHSNSSPLFEGGVSVSVSRSLEAMGLLNYGHAGSQEGVIVGTIGGQPLTGAFDDYNFWGAEAGVRLRNASGLGPYTFFSAGFRHVSQIDVLLVTSTTVGTATGYQSSTVPSLAFGGGVLFGDRSLAIGIELGVRYAGALKPASNAVITTPSGAGARWSLPVGVVFRF